MTLRRNFLIVGLIIGVVALLWGGSGSAQAHAVLVFADPEPNSIVNNSPTEMWILFSEPVEPAFSRITVLSQSGQQVDNGDLTVANEDDTALKVTLPELPEGTYLVSWQVLSTVDGHTTSGTFPFGIGVGELSGEVSAVSSSAQQPTVFSVGGRWLNLTGWVLLFGLFVFRLLVWQPVLTSVRLDRAEERLAQTFERTSLKFGYLALALLVVAAILTFISQSVQYELLNPDNFRAWLGTRFGLMWLWRLVLTILMIAAGVIYLFFRTKRQDAQRIARWQEESALALAAGLALTISLVSHSAALTSDDASLAFLADFLHVIAAGVWGGGLLLLGLALWLARPLPEKSKAWLNWGLILNFSALAAGAVGLLLLSGGYLSWQHVGSWTALFGTAYGLTLVAKIALALPAFGLAALNLLVIKPRLKAASTQPEADVAGRTQRGFRRLVFAEALFALLVLAAAGYLTDLQRGKDAPVLAEQPTELVLEGQAAADLNVTVNVEPAQVGQNSFDVLLTDETGRPIPEAKVQLRFTFLGQSMGTAQAWALSSEEPGHYQIDGGYLSLVGPWQIEVAVRRDNAFDAFAAYRVDSGLSSTFHPMGQESLLERVTQFLTQSGGSVTGTALILFAIVWAFLAGRAAKRDWQLVPLVIPGFIALWLGGMQIYTFFEEFTPAKFATNPILPDSGSITRGESLYTTNCMICHGPAGQGDGDLAASFTPPPADFTSGHTASHPDGDLHYWIQNGIPNTAMPAFGEQLSDEDIWHLVNYVRRLSAQAGGP